MQKAFKVPNESRKELKAAIDEVEKLIDEGHTLLPLLDFPTRSISNDINTVSAPPARPRITSSSPTVVFGRDGEVEMIRKMLHADDESKQSAIKCYSVIAIHGIPGSGKTTLAQKVFEEERNMKKPHFDLFMWIHVSQNFSVDTIHFEMLEVASGKKRDWLSKSSTLQAELEEQLCRKRIFLVLDDIWKRNGASDQNVLSPLKTVREGSKILVTSRIADAARDLGAQTMVPISEMDNKQYYLMFMHYTLDGVIIKDRALKVDLECIGRKIAEKLGGSPLAARIVAGQLRRRLDISFWTQTLNSDRLNDTVGALWWSYRQLKEPIKQCFAYCSMFPKRYQLKQDELVHLWMAQGFVETTDATEDIEDVGNEYFEELLSCSFIQSIGNSTAGSGFFRIHDLLHDLASKVAGRDCFIIGKGVDEIPQDVRHLFIESYDKKMHRDQIQKLATLRTLFMYSRSRGMSAHDLDGFLMDLKKLRVVHVNISNRGKIVIPACVGKLKHLRYIFLTGYMNRVTLRPEFEELYHLQKFGAPDCRLGYSAITKMSNLINLRYLHSMNTLEFPCVGRLKFLRTLSRFTVRIKGTGYEIQQVEHLNNISGQLRLDGLQAIESKEEAHQAKLYNKIYVSDLELNWSYVDEGYHRWADPQKQPLIFEALRPPPLLSLLSIKHYHASTYPSWLSGKQGTLENLQHLYFSNCNGSDAPTMFIEPCVLLRTLSISYCSWNSLPEDMRHFKSLEELKIMNCKNILSLPKLPVSLKRLSLIDWNGWRTPGRFGKSLVNLQSLQLHSCNWQSLPEGMEHLKSLKELDITDCKNILSLPKLPVSLERLSLVSWHQPHTPPRFAGSLVNLHYLHLKFCSWNSLPENMELLTSLEELTIHYCKNISLLPRLPQSIKKLEIMGCGPNLAVSCRTHGHQNWKMIAHIPEKFKSIQIPPSKVMAKQVSSNIEAGDEDYSGIQQERNNEYGGACSGTQQGQQNAYGEGCSGTQQAHCNDHYGGGFSGTQQAHCNNHYGGGTAQAHYGGGCSSTQHVQCHDYGGGFSHHYGGGFSGTC